MPGSRFYIFLFFVYKHALVLLAFPFFFFSFTITIGCTSFLTIQTTCLVIEGKQLTISHTCTHVPGSSIDPFIFFVYKHALTPCLRSFFFPIHHRYRLDFGPNNRNNVVCLGIEGKQTNNRAHMAGLINALQVYIIMCDRICHIYARYLLHIYAQICHGIGASVCIWSTSKILVRLLHLEYTLTR